MQAESLEVRIVGDDAGDFVPGELTVDVGQSVTFVNVHSDEHTATGSGFDTGIIPDEGGTATVVLDTPGVFPYACQIHPEMTGVIRVRDENGVVPETQTTAQDVPADATTVVIANLAFDPSAITVPTGTTVAWTNEDAVPHTVTSTDGAFDSGIFDPGGSFAFTFNEPGSFAYVCQLHPQMQGTVTAEGEAVAAAPATDAQAATAAADTTAQPQQAAEAGEASVSIVDFAFEPATLEVSAGTTVVWTNDGQAPHTVTGDFADSGVLESWSDLLAYVCRDRRVQLRLRDSSPNDRHGPCQRRSCAPIRLRPHLPQGARDPRASGCSGSFRTTRRFSPRTRLWSPFTTTARSKPIFRRSRATELPRPSLRQVEVSGW